MPITENVGGVLKTHTAEYANIDGVIKEQNTVSTNDGGVLRNVFSSDKFKLEGITPLVVADDHIVITQSGSGTISLPAGAKIILGSGAQGTEGGYVAEYTLTSSIINAQFTATVGAAGNRVKDATNMVIGGSTYGCGSTKQIINSRWGPIGGNGGFGSSLVDDGEGYSLCEDAEDGSGAGGGGGGNVSNGWGRGGRGGNRDGYGNKGGDGGFADYYAPIRSHYSGKAGSSGAAQTALGVRGSGSCTVENAYGNGGGGGFAAGGGVAASEISGYHGVNGNPGAGIIVIEL